MALVAPELLQQLEQKIKSGPPTSRPIVLVSFCTARRGEQD